jgi:hypothetical protein
MRSKEDKRVRLQERRKVLWTTPVFVGLFLLSGCSVHTSKSADDKDKDAPSGDDFRTFLLNPVASTDDDEHMHAVVGQISMQGVVKRRSSALAGPD